MRSKFKKITSIFLSLVIALGSIMLVSALSLTKASAADTPTTYKYKFYVKTNDSVDVGDNKDLTLTLYYKSDNGTGTEGSTSASVSYKWAEDDSAENNYMDWDSISGFATKVTVDVTYAWTAAVAREWNCTLKLYVYNNTTDSWSEIGSYSGGKAGGRWGQSNIQFQVDVSSGTPAAKSVNPISGVDEVNVPKTGTTKKTFTPGDVLDQYGVKWYENATLSMTSKYGCTFSNNVLSVPSSANRANDYSVTIKETYGTLSSTKTVDIIVFQYHIIFKNWDDTVLDDDYWDWGSTPSYSGTPTRDADVQYTYTFSGWDKSIATAKADATYKAVFSSVLNKYNVTFVNEDGTELQSGLWDYGSTPVYGGSTPTKPSTVEYNYSFSGWSPELDEVVGEATYTAQFTPALNQYTIKFLNDDGTELQSGLWEYGSTPVYSGSTPEKASDVEFNYTFADWDREIDEVTGDATYTATYTSSTRGYTVEWRDWDNSLIEKDENVLYNTVPTFDGETPEREADAHYSYTFKGWTPDVSKVTGNTVYTAAYNLVPQKYTITFKNEDGTVLEEKQVDYGIKPVYTGQTPTKAYTSRNHYTFNNVWSPAITIVTGDNEYTAQFTESRHAYSYYFDGSYHWQKCSCGHTTAKTSHVLDADGKCICGYDKNEMADYTEVEALIDNAPKSIYFTEESYAALIEAENAVDRTYDIGRQDEVDAMAESIRTAIDNLEPIKHTVSVTSGSVNQNVIKSVSRYYYIATVSAPKTNGSGQKFSYWEKTDGTKVATYRNYSFLVTEDITLRPVYGVSKDSADFPLYASRVIDIRDNGDKTHSILVEHSASTTVERITGHGVLITTDPSIGTNKDAMITTNDDVQDFAANKSARTLTGLLEVPVTFNTSGTVYARSYIIDSEGIVHLGEIYTFTVNGASTSASDEEIIAVDSVETAVEQNEADIADEPAQTGSVWAAVMNALMSVIARIFNFIKASAAIIKF